MCVFFAYLPATFLLQQLSEKEKQMKAIIAVTKPQVNAVRTIACVIQGQGPTLETLERVAQGWTALMDAKKCDQVGINALAGHPDLPGLGATSIVFHLDQKSSPQTDEALEARLRNLRHWLRTECRVTEIQETVFPTRGDLCIDFGESYRLN